MDASRQSLILVRLGEVTLKGLNRGKFISRLIGNMKRRLVDLGQFDIQQSHSRIWVRSMGETDLNDPELMAEAVDRLSRVFGLVSVSPAICLDSALELVKQF